MHVIGAYAPIIGWDETAQMEEHDIMFTFDSEALYLEHPSLACCWWSMSFLTFSSEPSDVSSPFEPDLVEFPCEVAAPCPVSHSSRKHGGSSFEVTWGLSTARRLCTCGLGPSVSSMRKRLSRVAGFSWCSHVSLPVP